MFFLFAKNYINIYSLKKIKLKNLLRYKIYFKKYKYFLLIKLTLRPSKREHILLI